MVPSKVGGGFIMEIVILLEVWNVGNMSRGVCPSHMFTGFALIQPWLP